MTKTTQILTPGSRSDVSLLTDQDIYLFNEGSHYRIYDKLGAHITTAAGQPGTSFSVWAPNAREVSVMGSFNEWNPHTHQLRARGDSGIWEGFVPGAGKGGLYKFHIVSQQHGYIGDKADPFGFFHEKPPRTASVIWDLQYDWADQNWMEERTKKNSLQSPISIYEVHLGSWMRVPEEHNRPLTYRETAPRLADYVQRMHFTHVELLPIMEHPFYGSWGYQTTGYFAPTARYGTPQDFMYLVDYLHQHGIGVILDWVPSHFPSDAHGLAYFDGTHLYEHADSRKGFHPDWKTHIFNYGRNEVRSFLYSSGLFWLDKYHADGLRVDAVASMLYLDYSRKHGEWLPNQFGGRENLEAIDFLRRFNAEVYKEYPGVQTIAEESTAWPMVSRPTYLGGLGFGLKWDMGWMHDTLSYFSHDPIHRRYHQNQLTFRMLYGFTENFVLPLSHDEVVHGKGSLIGKMPGDEWQKFANLRLLFGYMYAQSGKKLLFMGDEFGQVREWAHDTSLEWHVLQYPVHRGVQTWLAELNRTYAEQTALHELDTDPAGFEWVDCNDTAASVISLLRRSKSAKDTILVVCNFTPLPRDNYRVGVPSGGFWRELLNSDAREYGGSGWGNFGGVMAQAKPTHGRPYSVSLTLPPLAALFLKADCLNAKSMRSAWCTKAELSGDADSETTTEAPRGHMYYIGLDLHKKTISYCVKDASGKVHQQGKVGATRWELDAWLKTLPQPWTAAMEATIFTGWIYDHLKPHAAALKVAHPLMLRAIAASKKKNDRIDAGKLADCLRCDFLPECYMASTEIRERRRTLRYRNLLVRQAVQLKNRVSTLLMETGVTYNKQQLHRAGYFHELLASKDAIDKSIRPLLRMSRDSITRLQHVETALIRSLQRDPLLADRVRRLQTIPCVGRITALTWALEMGDTSRFRSIRQAISYCGLCGDEQKSAEKVVRTSLSKQRNKHVQHVLVEAAKLAPRYDPDLALLYAREKQKGNANRATLAVARKLLAYLLAVDREKRDFVPVREFTSTAA